MTGQEILEQALQLLHYTDADGQPESRFQADTSRMGLAAVNQVYADLWFMERMEAFEPLSGLEETVQMSSQRLYEAMPLGVAMWIAQADGDSARQGAMADAYNQKRAQCAAPARRRADVIPWGEGL